MEEIVVFVSTSGQAEAEEIAKQLLAEKLVACVNILPGITSLFPWEGKICREEETLMMLKTRKALFDPVARLVKKYHSYSVPEIIALPIVAGSEDYLTWLRENTKDQCR